MKDIATVFIIALALTVPVYMMYWFLGVIYNLFAH